MTVVTQRGFTYLGLLMAVVVMGLMLTVVGRVWSTTAQREREKQLLFVGHEFRNAFAGYFAHGRGYPQSLQDLLGDPNSDLPRRYLRRLYPDPMTGSTDWDLITAPGGGIMGIASKSNLVPMKRANFDLPDAAFTEAQCYCAWQFVYVPRRFNRGAPLKKQP
jgi:type II secretory pathway pseudopilin PulG